MEPDLYLTDVDCVQYPGKKRQLRTRVQMLNQNVWRKTIAKLDADLKREEYYEGKRLRPGINFWKILLETYEAGSPSIQSIRANIPETMCMQSNRYNIVYTHEGKVQRLVEASFQEFEKLVVPADCPNHLENRYSQPESNPRQRLSDLQLLHSLPELPLFVSRLGAGINFTKHIINAGEYRLKPLPTNENELYQRYLIPYQFRANLVRLHYFTRNSREQSKSQGWKLTNLNPMFDQKDIKHSLTVANLSINFEKEGSFECTALRGKSLEQYEKMAESVVSYLQECRDVVIREAVFDFTVDYHKVPWLVGLKMIKYDNRTALAVRLTQQEKAKQIEQITFSVTCRLCGIYFHKDSVNKLLTYKLLNELVEHLKKRNRCLSDVNLSDCSTRYCKVCNLCYSLVVAEHNLINAEQEMSIAQGIIEEEQLLRIGGVPRNRHQESMLQWRMMLYIEQINDVQLPAADFDNIFFQFKIDNFRTKFPLRVSHFSHHSRNPKHRPSSMFHTKTSVIEKDQSTWEYTKSNCRTIIGDESETQSLHVKRIKVQYFFSKSADIANFLSETELKFRLTKSADWGDVLAEGTSRTISHFNNRLKQGQRHSGQIFLFSPDMKHAKLQLHMGLVCDGAYSTDAIQLTEVNGVYFPTGVYYNCNPFPQVWMQIFQEDGLSQEPEEQVEETQLEKIDYLRFDCSQARKVRKMLVS